MISDYWPIFDILWFIVHPNVSDFHTVRSEGVSRERIGRFSLLILKKIFSLGKKYWWEFCSGGEIIWMFAMQTWRGSQGRGFKDDFSRLLVSICHYESMPSDWGNAQTSCVADIWSSMTGTDCLSHKYSSQSLLAKTCAL